MAGIIEDLIKSSDKKKFNTSRVILFPKGIERKYKRFINQTVFMPLFIETRKTLNENYASWSSEFKKDAYEDEYQDFIDSLNEIHVNNFGETMTPPEESNIYPELIFFATSVYLFNKSQLNQYFKPLLGFPVANMIDNSYFEQVSQKWAKDNYNLLNRYSTDAISQINEIISRNLTAGSNLKTIKEELSKVVNGSNNKASLLARDQVGTLYGLVNEENQTQLGIGEYMWNTVRDERVRGRSGGKYPNAIPSHWVMDGTINKWSDSSVYSMDGKEFLPRTGNMPSVHAGLEISCRCTGTPYIKDMF